MRSLLLTSISLLMGLHLSAAERADDYFHQGATNFVFEHLPQARQVVKAGLEKFPEDRELIELDKLLNQQQQQQNQQNPDDKQDQQQNSQDQQQKDDQKQNEQKQPQPDQQQEGKKPEDQQSKEGSADNDKKNTEAQQGQKPENEADKADQDQAQAAKMIPMQMTPQQAEQLLDAHKAEERLLLFTPQLRTNRHTRTTKDW